MTIWIKDGKFFNGRLELDGKIMFIAPPPPAEIMIRAGYTEYIPPTPEPPDMTAFNVACEQFRQICSQIAEAANLPDFKGGFDEMAEFQKSEIYGTVAGLQLAMAWSAVNELCKYEGGKVGYGQPEWWYYCWREENEGQPIPGENEE